MAVHYYVAVNLNDIVIFSRCNRLVHDPRLLVAVVLMPNVMQRNREVLLERFDKRGCFRSRTIVGNDDLIGKYRLAFHAQQQ